MTSAQLYYLLNLLIYAGVDVIALTVSVVAVAAMATLR